MNKINSKIFYLIQKRWLRRNNVHLEGNVHVGPLTRLWGSQKLLIQKDTYIGKFVTIEVDGSIGPGCLIANNVGIVGRKDHEYTNPELPLRKSKWVGKNPELASEVYIGADVWIGFGAVILGPISIGHSSIIAAGAIVVDDVPSFSIVAGNPGKIIGKRFNLESDRTRHTEILQECGYL
jgi:acetyltransferase-like isoleucine patch superfamily enzyme